MRPERPDDGVVAVLVGTQDSVRIVVRAGNQAGQVGRVGREVCPRELFCSTHDASPFGALPPAQQRGPRSFGYERHVDDVGHCPAGFDADVIHLTPLEFIAGDLVAHLEPLIRLAAQRCHVQPQRSLARARTR